MSAHTRFESLYHRAHAGPVKAYALRRTSPAAADDVVADTFLVVWRRLDDVPEPALPWLFGVARRVLANRRRGEGRAAALQDRLAGAAGRCGRSPTPASCCARSTVGAAGRPCSTPARARC